MPLLYVEVVRAQHIKASDRGGTSDPYVQLSLGKQKKQTTHIMKTLSPEWNEEFGFFVSDPFKQKLTVSLHDYDRMGANDSLGKAQVRLDSLNKAELKELWLPMDEKGRLMIRVRALDFGNPPASPEAETAMYNSAEKKVVIYLIGAEKMIAADANGTSDPFAKLILGGNKAVTKVIDRTLNPVWKECFVFPVVDIMQQFLRVEVYDKDFRGEDPIGKCSMWVNNLFRGYSNDAWVPLLFKNHETGEWYPPKKGSRVHIIACPIGYGKIPPESEKEDAQIPENRITKAQEKAAYKAKAAKEEQPVSNRNSVELVIIEALGGKFAGETHGVKASIRATLGGNVYQTSAKNDLRHPKWNETCKFPVNNFKQTVYVELLNGDSLVGEATFKLRKISKEKDDVWLVMLYDEEGNQYSDNAPRVHLTMQGIGPDVGKDEWQTFKHKKQKQQEKEEAERLAREKKEQEERDRRQAEKDKERERKRRQREEEEERRRQEAERRRRDLEARREMEEKLRAEREAAERERERATNAPPPQRTVMVDEATQWSPPEGAKPDERSRDPERLVADYKKNYSRRGGSSSDDSSDDSSPRRKGRRRGKHGSHKDKYSKHKTSKRRHRMYASESDSDEMNQNIIDWRMKLSDIPRSPGEMIWFKVLVYLMMTTKPLSKAEYKMLLATREELLGNDPTTPITTVESTLREWISRRQQDAGAADQYPMVVFGQPIPTNLNLVQQAQAPNTTSMQFAQTLPAPGMGPKSQFNSGGAPAFQPFQPAASWSAGGPPPAGYAPQPPPGHPPPHQFNSTFPQLSPYGRPNHTYGFQPHPPPPRQPQAPGGY
eukprot:TRINITY_DN21127_c0_g1_i1.p1 TRINITY_DN21127_c0_g1~~TRINITY_DN21127_c0_g1_i1.p1  ORF type:complete len:829 (-),score=106.19 TRINITY_DN21127_c0_g1_i1:51-2537(-)